MRQFRLVTGYGHVNGWLDLDYADGVRLDLEYAGGWFLSLDLAILNQDGAGRGVLQGAGAR